MYDFEDQRIDNDENDEINWKLVDEILSDMYSNLSEEEIEEELSNID